MSKAGFNKKIVNFFKYFKKNRGKFYQRSRGKNRQNSGTIGFSSNRVRRK